MTFKKMLAAFCGMALTFAASTSVAQSFANGADVGWVSQQESAGYSFYNSSGVKTDPFVLLKNLNINAIRLRVWAKPGWNDGADVLYKAKRAAAQGQRIMIDFHYSDSWADPGQQTKPAAWANHSLAQLNTDVYTHTRDTLNYLKSNGINVEWVQVGNEINSGMLWPEGKTTSFANLAGLINSGYNASKSVYPNAKVILHLANGYDNAVFRWFFDGVKGAGAKWDVIGMSHYPPPADWTNYNNKISINMKDMVARYAKPVMVTEVGMDWTQAATSKAMVADLLTKTKALGSNGLGVFYWEPQAYPGWQNYTFGALDGSGKFTIALDPF
ncbi:glycoside hydrolase family 53 protein [Duganella phyllosphaerae]|uniref:Arabinogalactan endo-beta-1,4-galactanase n=1 Tax=Duganella phyllosphaerae TaxID=762836 RepID=A0A1E7WHL2_9BURK|nr:glycosyl hydrolase 53 family protein [Duganella phyllosphaerae]OEZ98082.1 arabinogalactan endo-1,4-beta-galactosidase precursor [Duganella phyllosphaerae]